MLSALMELSCQERDHFPFDTVLDMLQPSLFKRRPFEFVNLPCSHTFLLLKGRLAFQRDPQAVSSSVSKAKADAGRLLHHQEA